MGRSFKKTVRVRRKMRRKRERENFVVMLILLTVFETVRKSDIDE